MSLTTIVTSIGIANVANTASYEIPVWGELRSCFRCGRRVLVEDGHMGVAHCMPAALNCWDCMPPDLQQKCIEKYRLKV